MSAPRRSWRPVPSAGELLVEREATRPVTHVRSTLIQSSLQTLRGFNFGEQYVEQLPRQYHQDILHTLTPVWLPIAVADAHYAACEALKLTEQQQLDIGNAVSQRVQGTFLKTVARTGKNLGATPWTVLMHVDKVWDRTFQGGGCRLVKLGPKDARIELWGLSFAGVPYFRNAYRGAFLMAASIFAQRAFCHLELARSGATRLCYKLAWA